MQSILLAALLLGGLNDQTYPEWRSETVSLEKLPKNTAETLHRIPLESAVENLPKRPFPDATVAVRKDGDLWIGSRQGLMLKRAEEPRWRLFHSRRWLPADEIQALSIDDKGDLYAKTPAGIVRFWQGETTLDEKMNEIHEKLRKWHLRLGMVAHAHLKEPGNPEAGVELSTDDNDGLWTALYVAAEAFRFGVTGDEEARENAWKSLEAMLFLEEVTGMPGYAARSVVPGDEPNPGLRHGGEWHKSADDQWWWKSDTSSDEVDGHYFAYAIYYDIAATDEQKERIRETVTRMTDHIIDNGYYYIDVDGKPTRWGVWAPEKLNNDLSWYWERGINSLEILSHLKVAHHITGNPRYAEAATELIEKHGYAMNTVRQKMTWPPSEVNHSDDELSFVAYYPLVWLERDPELRKYYLASIHESFEIERPEASPLFNYIYAAALQANQWTKSDQRPTEAFVPPQAYDHERLLEWFREVPKSQIEWTVHNSGRQDIDNLRVNRAGQVYADKVLPIAERGIMRWNGDPFTLDRGTDGRRRADGVQILLPYWMGRYHRFLE